MTRFRMKLNRDGRQRRRRKQPKVRRMQAASSLEMPTMRVPETARRRRKRNRRKFRVPIGAIKRVIFSARWISLFLCVLVIGTLVLMGTDEGFYVTYIPVEGVAAVPPQEVVDASNLAGTHVFAADPESAAAQIAELPGVISATVTLRWPNEVHISIREDVPVAIWEQDGQQYWISQSGALLPARMVLEGLLTIQAEGLSSTQDEPAVAVNEPEDEENVEAAMPLLFVPPDLMTGAMQLHDLRPGMNVLSYDPTGGLSFIDGNGWRAYFGTGEDMARKIAVYEKIVTDLQTRNLEPIYISVSNQEKPYYLTAEREESEG
jgi:hypothetical protein